MIYNLTKNRPVARNPVFASSFLARGRGMIGRDFQGFDAMVFQRCNAIHTLFMSKPIDVLFVDLENRVCGICGEVSPWRPIVRCPHAVTVIEMCAGSAEGANVEVGDVLDLNAELSETGRKIVNQKMMSATAEPVMPLHQNLK